MWIDLDKWILTRNRHPRQDLRHQLFGAVERNLWRKLLLLLRPHGLHLRRRRHRLDLPHSLLPDHLHQGSEVAQVPDRRVETSRHSSSRRSHS